MHKHYSIVFCSHCKVNAILTHAFNPETACKYQIKQEHKFGRKVVQMNPKHSKGATAANIILRTAVWQTFAARTPAWFIIQNYQRKIQPHELMHIVPEQRGMLGPEKEACSKGTEIKCQTLGVGSTSSEAYRPSGRPCGH